MVYLLATMHVARPSNNNMVPIHAIGTNMYLIEIHPPVLVIVLCHKLCLVC
jgi:hypothetical protein